MFNPAAPSVTIPSGVLGDREWELKYTLGAQKALKKATNKGFLNGDLIRDIENEDTLSLLLFHGLKWQDSKLTQEALDDLIHTGNMAYLAEKIVEVYSLGMKKSESTTEGEAQASPPALP